MPAIRRYRVSETREVDVDARTAVEAAQIADVAFRNGQNSDHGVVVQDLSLEGTWGNTVTEIRTTDITVREN